MIQIGSCETNDNETLGYGLIIENEQVYNYQRIIKHRSYEQSYEVKHALYLLSFKDPDNSKLTSGFLVVLRLVYPLICDVNFSGSRGMAPFYVHT